MSILAGGASWISEWSHKPHKIITMLQNSHMPCTCIDRQWGHRFFSAWVTSSDAGCATFVNSCISEYPVLLAPKILCCMIEALIWKLGDSALRAQTPVTRLNHASIWLDRTWRRYQPSVTVLPAPSLRTYLARAEAREPWSEINVHNLRTRAHFLALVQMYVRSHKPRFVALRCKWWSGWFSRTLNARSWRDLMVKNYGYPHTVTIREFDLQDRLKHVHTTTRRFFLVIHVGFFHISAANQQSMHLNPRFVPGTHLNKPPSPPECQNARMCQASGGVAWIPSSERSNSIGWAGLKVELSP